MEMRNLSATEAENENCNLVCWRIQSPLSQLFLVLYTRDTEVRLLTNILFCIFETHCSYQISKTFTMPVCYQWIIFEHQILIFLHNIDSLFTFKDLHKDYIQINTIFVFHKAVTFFVTEVEALIFLLIITWFISKVL